MYTGGREIMGLTIGTGVEAPDFRVSGPDESSIRLSDYRGRTVVLYFFPKSFTGGCTTQACSLRDAYSNFADRRVEVIGVSVDDVDTQRRFRAEHGLPFPVVADPDGRIARAYGVYGNPKSSGEVLGQARRVTFVIDPMGVIRTVIDPATAALHADEVLKLLHEHGTSGAIRTEVDVPR
jgi:peroxiredoxin Q/BCP